MPQADRLIAALQSEGRVDSDGEFTLDREKAREKMRQFQLQDPRRYVLLLVEAAVLKGATHAEFRIDADDMRMTFDGRPFSAADFDQIYGSLFTRSAGADGLARRQLALALNAAMALNPRWVRVESGDGSTGSFLDLRPRRPDGFGPLEKAAAGTVIHVKDRFRPGLVVSFVRNIGGTLAEEVCLRDACRFADIPILLEGKRLSTGLAGGPWPDGTLSAPLAGTDVSGFAMLPPLATGAAVLHFVFNGVVAATHAWRALPDGFVCIVSSPLLKKDVSQADLVRDENYIAVVNAVLVTCDKVLEQLADRLAGGMEGTSAPWARGLLREAARRHLRALRNHVEHNAPLHDLDARLAQLPLWPTADGSLVGIARLADDIRRCGKCAYATFDTRIPLPDGRAVLRFAENDEPFFVKLSGGGVECVDAALRAVEKRQARRFRWLAGKTSAFLPADLPYPARVRLAPLKPPPGKLSLAPIEGEVALSPTWPSPSRVRFVNREAYASLGDREVFLPVPGVAAVLVSDFRPDDDFSNPQPDDVMAAAVLALVASLEPLFRSLAQDLLRTKTIPAAPARTAILSYLGASTAPRFAAQFLEAFGFATALADKLVTELAAPDAFAPPRLGIGPAAGGSPHPLALVPLFESLDGKPRSLTDLALHLQRSGPLPYALRAALPATRADRFVLLLEPQDIRLLLELLGPTALRDASAQLREQACAENHARLPQELVDVPPGASARVSAEGEGFNGILGVFPELGAGDPDRAAPPWPARARIRLLRTRRFLAEKEFVVPCGPLQGVLNADDIRANAAWTDVDDPPLLARISASLPATSLALLAELCKRLPGLDPTRRTTACRLLLSAAAAPFPADEFRHAWSALVAALGPERALQQYRVALGFAMSRGVPDTSAALELSFGQGETPLAKDFDLAGKLAELLAGPEIPAGRASAALPTPLFDAWLAGATRDTVLLVPPALLAAPLLRSLGGRAVTLAALAEHLQRSGTVGYVGADFPEEPDDETLVLRADAVELALLRRLVGAERLAHVSQQLDERRRRRALETRPVVENVALDPRTAFVADSIAVSPVTGEVGLSAAHSGASPQLALTICSHHRLLRTVHVESRHQLLAVLNDDGLTPSREDPTAVDAADVRRLAALCQARVSGLVRRLARRWPELSPEQRTTAWRHVLDYLVAAEPRRSLTVPRLKRDGTIEVLAAVEGFLLADGSHVSFAELERRAQACGRMLHVPQEAAGQLPQGLRRWVVVVSWFELERLEAMFEEVSPALGLSLAEHMGLARRLSAPPLTLPASPAALVRTAATRKDIDVLLYLPSAPTPELLVSFGRDGLLVEKRPVCGPLACTGVVLGAAVLVPPEFDRVELSADQDEWLRALTLTLYRDLYVFYRNRAKRRSAEWNAAETYLRDAVQRLALVNAGPPGGLTKDEKELFDRLCRLKLITLPDGRRVTCAQASPDRAPARSTLPLFRPEDLPAPAAQPDDASTTPSAGTAEAVSAEPLPELPAEESRRIRFLEALQSELRRMGKAEGVILGRLDLDALSLLVGHSETIAECKGNIVILHEGNPVVRAALDSFESDPVPLAFVVSALFTTYNIQSTTVSDREETEFQRWLARRPPA